MKNKVLSLFITAALFFLCFAPGALSYSGDDVVSIHNSISNYINENADAIKTNIKSEADGFCGYAMELAEIMADYQNNDIAYEIIYSVYSYVSLVVNNDPAKSDAIKLYEKIASDFITDEYFDLNPEADEAGIKNLVAEKKYDMLYESLCDAVYKYLEYTVNEAEKVLLNINGASQMMVFEDVSEGDWFFDAVSFAYSAGLFKGTSETLFSPQLTMTRGMFITVLKRFAAHNSFESTKDHGYTDVPQDAYYKEAVSWAKEAGIIEWAPDDMFYPDQPVTREEMVFSMYKFAKSIGKDVSFGSEISGLADMAEISPWATEGIDWAYGTGVIKGYGDGTIKPKGTATRAEVAQVFLNYFAVITVAGSAQ